MANNDSAAYELRYNEVTQAIEAAIGGRWFAPTIAFSGTINSTAFTNVGTFSNTGTMDQNGQLFVDTDNTNGPGNQSAGSIAIRGFTNPTKQLSIGYNTNADYAWIQAINYGNATNPLILQSSGGGVGIGNAITVDASAALQVISTTQGIMFPVMTTAQKNAIGTPAEGLVVYDVTLHKLCVRAAAAWETITSV